MSGVIWSVTAGSVDSNGNFTAPSGTASMTVTVTATSVKDTTKTASSTVNVVAPGSVTQTSNPQVASYAISPAAAGNVSVQFGTDTNYGLTTWTQPVPTGGGAVSLFIAGMKASTPYHMRGVVAFTDGSQYTDADTVFTTGTVPTTKLPTITVTTTPGATPQGGVELLDLVGGSATIVPVAVSDLQGNVLWTYSPKVPGQANPIKLPPNGHFLINFSDASLDGANSVLQEIDLTGAVIWQMTAAQLNTALAAATCTGCNITVQMVERVPQPHGIVILVRVDDYISCYGCTRNALLRCCKHDQMAVRQLHKIVVRSQNVNRQPMGCPDWTHANAILYSSDDGNLIVSLRHQNWLLKIDYANGSGAGDIIWHLGYQGDLTLMGGTDPADWFYAQHGPSFASTNTAGKFTLALFDNGDDRVFPSGVTCGTTGNPPCHYSTRLF